MVRPIWHALSVWRHVNTATLRSLFGFQIYCWIYNLQTNTFHFPSFYGENLDALWDMGCDYIGSDDEVFEFVKIRGVHTLPKDIREYFMDKMMPIFYEIEEFWGSKNVKFKIED